MSETRVPAGIPTGGQFAASQRSEAEVNLDADERSAIPRRPDGAVDTEAAVRDGFVEGFDAVSWAEPRTLTLVGHWDCNALVIESTFDGDVPDDRVDDGYWPEGLWAASGTGTSEAEIAASMLDEYDECDVIRVALTDDDYTPDDEDEEEVCAADDCDDDLSDNEGWDGYCGTHADKIATHEDGEHDQTPDRDCPEC